MASVALALSMLAGIHLTAGLIWDASFPNGTEVGACIGERVTFAWNYSTEPGEQTGLGNWRRLLKYKDRNSTGSEPKEMTRMGNILRTTDGLRMVYGPGATMVINNATVNDTGDYFYIIASRSAGNLAEKTHVISAHLVVQEPPELDGNRLVVNWLRTPRRDAESGQWNIVLTCGRFTDRGTPPVDVIWTTPSGQSMNSTVFDTESGQFQLLLPSSFQGGVYSCVVDSLARRCASGGRPLLWQGEVTVNELIARLVLMDTRINEKLDQQHNMIRQADENAARRAGRCRLITDVRLLGGRNNTEGRVEVYTDFGNYGWGTICDDLWDNNDASVICRMLGYRGGTAVSNAAFGQGKGPILLDDVGCPAGGSCISDCPHYGLGRHNCNHSEDAGVVCTRK